MRVSAVILTSALLAILIVIPGAVQPAWAQSPFGVNRATAADSQRAQEALSLYAYQLDYQKASDALALVQPLLSSRGTVELRPGDNTLVVRDSLAALTRIIPALRRFDHPLRSVTLEVMVVQAHRIAFSPAVQPEDLPEELLSHFRKLLPYSTYRVLARSEVKPTEGQEVMYEMGSGFGVGFRLGTMLDEGHIRLHDFRIARREEGEPSKQLIRTTLSLRLDQPFALALTKSESSATALMVVLTPKPGAAAGKR